MKPLQRPFIVATLGQPPSAQVKVTAPAGQLWTEMEIIPRFHTQIAKQDAIQDLESSSTFAASPLANSI